MEPEQITPQQIAQWKAEYAHAVAEADARHAFYLMFELARTALPALIAAYDRLTAQLALEQTASTRTIEHLVARKDALEEQYKILSEQSRITLEVAANTEDALIERVQALEGALAILQRSYDELFNSRERWSDEKIEELKLFLRVARAETKESEKERDALAAAMPSEGADAALAYAAMKAERDRLQNRLRDYEEDRKDTTLYRAEADPTP